MINRESKLILIVEGDFIVNLIVKKYLNKNGYTVPNENDWNEA
jgi:CheY-like chemotaxis protein